MSTRVRYAIVSLLALSLSFILADTAVAEDTRPLKGRRVLRGEIIARDEESISVARKERVVRLEFSSGTSVRIFGHLAADTSDLLVGDQVMVWLAVEDGGQPLARLIVRQPEGEHVAGRLVDRLDDALLIRTSSGQEVTVTMRPDTLLAFRRQEFLWSSKLARNAAVPVGMRLVAFGSRAEDGQGLNAHTLVSFQARPRTQWWAGEIVGIVGHRFTLVTSQGQEFEVQTTPHTRLQQSEGRSSLEDFGVGDEVIVAGRQTGSGRLRAGLVALRPTDWSHGRPLIGKIQHLGEQEIVLNTSDGGTISIVLDEETQYRIGCHGEATLRDFTVDEWVLVLGTLKTEKRFRASYLFKRGGDSRAS